MSFVKRFRDNKVKPLTVKVLFPIEEPELEFEIYRVSTVELRELYKSVLSDSGNRQFQVELTFNTFDKLMSKIKDIKPVGECEFKFDKKQLEELRNTFMLADTIDFVNAYNAAIEAEAEAASVSEKNE